jgi:hypothetical protein
MIRWCSEEFFERRLYPLCDAEAERERESDGRGEAHVRGCEGLDGKAACDIHIEERP